ncbi:MAG: peptidoglycan DD-metalloendopeptidase family protein [Betaproteobacteria bacterium]|nr:peptidoglycan DD-metalloendopeptidase family protein [Betaproteobacteria bacterium]
MLAAVMFVLVACASRAPAPVEDRASFPVRPSDLPVLAVPPATIGASVPTTSDAEPRIITYTVKRGDTLHQIALEHGLDYRELAAWNNVENPNVIRVGQILRITPPGDAPAATSGSEVVTAPLKIVPSITDIKPGVAGPLLPAPSSAATTTTATTPAARHTDQYKSSPKAVKEPYSEQAARQVAKAASATSEVATSVSAPIRIEPKPEMPRGSTASAADIEDDERLDWVWPSKGKLVGGFSDTANLKGIDIAGTSGQPIVASAGGRVVYAGSGLRGYGKLVIIKHNKTYLSAYAHNRDLLVKEGQQVTRGQKIAEMGNTDADQVKLHFEIRRLGKPIDPAKFLPPG